MKKIPTQKLYYKSFVHCIKFKIPSMTKYDVRNNSVINDIRNTISENGAQCRTRIDWNFTSKRKVDITFSVYFSEDDLYTLLTTGPHSGLIYWISTPASQTHRELLLQNVEIMLRDRLLYNRFRYKVHLRVGWRDDTRRDLNEWIITNFNGKINSKSGDYLLLGHWNPCLYLSDDADLMLVKLSISEHIINVVRVDRFSDHGITEADLAEPST